jgi:segregation and condensation protein B
MNSMEHDLPSGADYSTQGSADTPESEGASLMPRLEALLFVAGSPVTPSQLAEALNVSPREVEGGLKALDRSFLGRGIRLQWHQGSLQLTTAAEWAQDVERFLDLEGTTRLTRAALEVLSIVAYEQPVTRPKIDSVRGVNSETSLQTLLRHGLIEEVGRAEGAGRPILYATTPAFLQHFGLSRLGDLPPLQLEGEAAETVVQVGEATDPADAALSAGEDDDSRGRV